MIEEGFELMMIGMGVVLAFLVLLVGLMRLSGSIFTRFPEVFPDPEPTEPSEAASHTAEKRAVALAAAFRARHGHRP